MKIVTKRLIKPKYFYSLYIKFYVLLSININWLYFIKEIKSFHPFIKYTTYNFKNFKKFKKFKKYIYLKKNSKIFGEAMAPPNSFYAPPLATTMITLLEAW